MTLTADLSGLTAKERQMLGLFIDAAVVMDDLFWTQAYPGDREALLAGLQDPDVRRFAEMNYGPWDRLEGNAPFVPGVGARPPGAGFYPLDMTKEEFERADLPRKTSEYTVLRRDAKGALGVVPYCQHWRRAARSRRGTARRRPPGSRRTRASRSTSTCVRRRCCRTSTAPATGRGST